jgi:hypothetical protein
VNNKLFRTLLAVPIQSNPLAFRIQVSSGAMQVDGCNVILLTSTACFLPLSAIAIRR